MSCDKGERAGIGLLVKEIAFWDGEWVQSIWIDADASKGWQKEAEKGPDVSLHQIYTYRSKGGRTLIFGQTIYSSSGGVTDRLASELKSFGRISFFYRIVNFWLHAQSKALQKSVEH